ncbi:hypothetical protein ROHU_030091 [Labeo rohita]|uniref:Ig-like domain-containing protein n=1 Tax=Labeo rohita TaxID=84645 RepID=A0A498M132_LABRO|nr:hypothetical protein ROHU_030091 [Labeo rohita]
MVRVLLILLLWLTAACLGKTVLQTPANLIKNQDESAMIICTHNIQSYYRILWYKQNPDMLGFKLMGFLNYDAKNEEPDFKNKIKLDGNGEENDDIISCLLCLYFIAKVLTLVQRADMMNAFLIKCACLLWLTGTVGGNDVVQEPIIWKAKGASAVMNCTQNKGTSYSLMYWYKQRPGETMKLIVITNAYGDPEFGDVDKNKYETEKNDPKNGSLTVKNLESDDSAIYFCSASEHNDITSCLLFLYFNADVLTLQRADIMNAFLIKCACLLWLTDDIISCLLCLYFIAKVLTLVQRADMMNAFLIRCAYLLWLTVANHAKTVLQTPVDLIKNQDESAVITCSHNIQSYDRMLWYKQSQDMPGLTLMGYLYFEENKEPAFTKKIKLEGDAKKKGTLTINNLTAQDSAEYFCAAWYTVI